jgi:hypothetical protein
MRWFSAPASPPSEMVEQRRGGCSAQVRQGVMGASARRSLEAIYGVHTLGS